MYSSDISKNLIQTVQELSSTSNCDFFGGKHYLIPNNAKIKTALELLEAVILPYCYSYPASTDSIEYFIGRDLNIAVEIFKEQIFNAVKLNFTSATDIEAAELTESAIISLIKELPKIRQYIIREIDTAFRYDPAAKSLVEVLICYPALKTLLYHKIAHELYLSEIPVIPRMVNEIAHSLTGIDIHPGAEIGEAFFIDHGTGIIIGETTIIGNNVKIYQGVTLGAKSAALDENGKPMRGIPRHPIIEDDVIIYPNTTILGRVIIGKGSIIGGNMWLIKDVPPNSRISL